LQEDSERCMDSVFDIGVHDRITDTSDPEHFGYWTTCVADTPTRGLPTRGLDISWTGQLAH